MRVVLRWSAESSPRDGAGRAAADALVRRTVAELGLATADDVVVARRCPRCGSSRHGRPLARIGAGAEVPVSVSRGAGLVVVAVVDPGAAGTHAAAGAGVDGAATVGVGVDGAAVLGVGVDVEPPGRSTTGLADLLYPVGRGAGPARVEPDLLRRWVRTEAVLKAAGTGLTVDPREVAVEPPDAVLVPSDLDAPAWWVTDLAAVPGCVGALALRLARPLGGDDGNGNGVTLDAAPG